MKMSHSNQENLKEQLSQILKGGGDKDKLYNSLKSIIETVPGGTLVSYFYQTYITAPATQRLNAFLESLVKTIGELEEKVNKFSVEDALKTPSATTTLMYAFQIASRNHQLEKLDALRNAVVNSLLSNAPDEDKQLVFLNLVDDFTASHLIALKLLESPYRWCIENNIDIEKEGVMLSLLVRRDYPDQRHSPETWGYIGILERAFPKIYEESDFYKKVFKDLFSQGLTRVENLNDFELPRMSGDRPLHFTCYKGQIATDWIDSVMTPFGQQFINFVKYPLA